MMNLFIDRKYRLPRIWSNQELKKFAPLFSGNIVNVSGWKDQDKEGRFYRDYFQNASTYTITNYKSEARGFQGYHNELFLDLEEELPPSLLNRFDVVFNHTVLEHVYHVGRAFRTLCLMTKDILIVVVPFLQQMHVINFGDYWRFTPLTIKQMVEDNGMSLLYLSFNHHRNSSVYIFAVASKNPSQWEGKIEKMFTYRVEKPRGGFEPFIGCNAIQNNRFIIGRFLKKIFRYCARKKGEE